MTPNLGRSASRPSMHRAVTVDRPAERRPASLGLLGIIVVSVALRLASALLQGDAVTPLPGIYDQLSYDELARRLLAGHGFTFPTDWWPATRAGEPTGHWSYLYTLFLAATYAVTHSSLA